MRLILLVATLAVALPLAAANKTIASKPTKAPASTGDNREKRTIKSFSSYPRPSFEGPQISKRIATGYPSNDQYVYNTQPFSQPSYDPLVPEYVRDFESHESNSINNELHQQQYVHHVQHPSQYHHTQYLEAPEPIIEIIIKESNETLPVPQAQVAPAPTKNKKEQVQVFYVKYQKDEHKGLVIDDPVAALSPSAYHQESSEEEHEESIQEHVYDTTAPPPVRTTTLRTIIHPDSERYHSNSGIQVTFNSEDKTHSSNHQYQEHIEASDLQPVVAHQAPHQQEPRYQQRPVTPPAFQSSQQYHQAQQQHQAQQGGSRNFDFQSRFDTRNQYHSQAPPPQFVQQQQQRPQQLSLHQELPHPHTPSQSFRNEPVQRPPPNRFAAQPPPQQQYHQQPTQHHQQPPQHHQHFEHQQQFSQQPPKFRVPQPIPVHNVQQQHQTLPTLNRPPQFTNHAVYNQEFHQSNQQQSSLAQYRVRPQQSPPPPPAQNQYRPQQQPQLQSGPPPQYHSQQQPTAQHNQAPIRPSQPLNEFSQGGLVQSAAPNLSQQQPPVGHDFVGKIVPGTELLQSVPKFEQHITQTVPFGQPIRPFDQPTQQRPVAQPLQQQPQSHQEQHIVQPTHTQYQQYHPDPATQTQSPLEEPNQFEKEFFQHQQERQQQERQQQERQQQERQQQERQQQQKHQKYQQQQQQQHYQPQQTQQYPTRHQYASKPVQQSLVPGQSVSTLASEVFPKLESQLKDQYSYDQGFSTQSRNREPISVTLPKQPSSIRSTTTTTTTTPAPPTAAPTKKPSKAQFDLPDEVPDDLRAQLLSSGILDNADISVLDYDKVGDVPIESLPAEHLANFYGGGGAAQLSSSNKVVTVVKPNGDLVHTKKPSKEEETSAAESSDEANTFQEHTSLPRRQNVDLKVVRFDSNSQKSVTDKYIRSDSTVLPSVQVSEEDRQYNRYLPLKVNGAQFPYPDAKELKGRKISSVVVLAPVDNQTPLTDSAEARFERDVVDNKQIKFVAGDSLKQLLKKPTKENFKRWLDKESKTDVDLQSVVLLVTKNEDDGAKEIYMYDITTQHVSKLNGELSSAFVNVAEENATAQDIENSSISDSGIVEQMAPQSGDIDAMNDAAERLDADTQPSQIVQSYALPPNGFDPTKQNQDIQINSGYSVIS